MKLGSETASVMNHIYSGVQMPEPKVGMGATILMWTDRHPGTIISVSKGKIVVQEDFAKRSDSNGMSDDQHYEYSPNPNGRIYTFTLRHSRSRPNPRWVEKGIRGGGAGLLIGDRRKYHDFSF